MLRVRHAASNDSSEIAALTKEVFAALRTVYTPLPTVQAMTGEWLRLVAVDEGGIVGTLQYQARRESIHVRALAVRADRRRRGVARHLIEFVANEARTRKLERVTLHTVKQTGNVAIFERLGFTTVREEPDPTIELAAGGIALDILMERPLR